MKFEPGDLAESRIPIELARREVHHGAVHLDTNDAVKAVRRAIENVAAAPHANNRRAAATVTQLSAHRGHVVAEEWKRGQVALESRLTELQARWEKERDLVGKIREVRGKLEEPSGAATGAPAEPPPATPPAEAETPQP